jgi:hypothetical protein
MSPVTSTPGLKPQADGSPKGPVELSAHAATAHSPVHSTVHSTAQATAQATAAQPNAGTVRDALPVFNPGKPIPSLEEWRALERRASSFRA